MAVETKPKIVLPKDSYEGDRTGGPGRYNLVRDQYRAEDPLISQGVWFNSQGERLGVGDLSQKDFDNIKLRIPTGEAFIVLSTQSGLSSLSQTTDPYRPGLEYVADNCRFIVTKGNIYSTEELRHSTSKEIKLVTPEEAKKLLMEEI